MGMDQLKMLTEAKPFKYAPQVGKTTGIARSVGILESHMPLLGHKEVLTYLCYYESVVEGRHDL